MRLVCVLGLGWWLAVSGLAAVGLDSVASGARSDLDEALAKLRTLREQIQAERLPLARQVHTLEDKVSVLRSELARAQRSADNELVELNALKAATRGLSNEVSTAEGLLGAFREAFNTRLHASEAPQYEEVVRRAEAARAQSSLPPADRLAAQLDLLDRGLEHLEDALGGRVFAGDALNAAGRLERGQFVVLGPAAWFAGDGDGVAGLAQLRLNSPAPEVTPTPIGTAEGIRAVVREKHGVLPVDVTLGTALKIQATHDPLWVHIRKGGPVMVPILLLGLAAVIIFLLKWVQVSRVRVPGPADLSVVLSAIKAGDQAKAASHARGIPGPSGRLLEAAIAHCREPKDYVEEVLYERMLAIRPRLEKLLPFLALAAAAAPLLGLLGTVTGMINTFNMITVFGTGDPKTLAGGISEALITTEFGLVVAIPSLLLHAVLSRKVKGVLGGLEQLSVSFINGLPETKRAE